MKKTRKILAMAACAILLVCISVGATVAYLTSTDEVTNTFTIGTVAITLDEAPVGADGKKIAGNRVKANSYKLMPGHTYTKDPTIHVAAASDDCYLFVKVANEITAIEGETTVAAQMTAKGWVAVDGVTGVYVYTQSNAPAVVAGGSNVTVFDNFTISGTVDNATLATYNNKTITVTAYAIQADGFEGKTASEIWTAAGFTK